MRQDEITLRVAASAMVLMFIVSGLRKVASAGQSEAERLAKKIKTNMCSAKRLVFLAGVIELLGSLLILYGVWYSSRVHAEVGAAILVVFTALATLIFYTNPVKIYPLMSNLTVASGLVLLPMVCALRH